MQSITPAQFKMLIDQNDGDEEAARAQAEQQGFTVEGDAASDLSARPDIAALKGILTDQRQSIGTLYDTITQNIQKRYRAPDINDLLISIGTGMMSAPQEGDNSGFAGAIQRGVRGIGPYAQSRRAYETDMNKMMSQVEIQKAKDLAGLEEKYATGAAGLLKPNTTSQYTYAADRGGYLPKPGTGNSPAMPEMDQYGNYVITDQRQVTYLPPNTPIVLPGGDPTKPRYTRSGTTR